MRHLTVLYDAQCGFCRRCRAWLEGQPTRVPLRLLAMDSAEAAAAYPDLTGPGRPDQLIAIDDSGGVYVGDAAWLASLHATVRYRHAAHRLASPGVRPLARGLYGGVARWRHQLSRIAGVAGDDCDGTCPTRP